VMTQMNYDSHIVKTAGKAFNKFISSIAKGLSKPKTKFTSQLLCGIIFSGNLILTNIASKVPHPGRLTAIAKVFNLRSFVPAREKFCPSWWLRQAKTAQLIPNTSLMRGALSKMGHHKIFMLVPFPLNKFHFC